MHPKIYMPTTHAIGCNDAKCAALYCTNDVSFVCPRCERLLGYCMGQADEMPALCDDCWAAVNAEEEAA